LPVRNRTQLHVAASRRKLVGRCQAGRNG
jgi:hypothetical protein